ncbi:unnamed protein product [Rotaria socialis]
MQLGMTTSNDYAVISGGLRIRNPKTIDITLFCELCKLLLLDPIQLSCCGSRLCRWCSIKGVPENEPFTCLFCYNTTETKKQAHADRGAACELNMVKIECFSCSWNGLYSDYKIHLEKEHADFECIECHQRFYSVNLYQEHREEICEYRCMPCGLPGCTELIKWSDMGAHCLSMTHQTILFKLTTDICIRKKHPSNTIDPCNVDSNIQQELMAVNENNDSISSAVDNSLEDCKRLNSECEHIQTKNNDILQQESEIGKELQSGNEKFKKCMDDHTEMEKQLDDAKNSRWPTKPLVLDMNDTITFPIAKEPNEINAQFSTQTPEFSTSAWGYKLMLRICSTYLSGAERQEYLSIYVSLLRGNMDSILVFPFPYDIYVCLCDQSRQKKDIELVIKPGDNVSAFNRPSSDRNSEVGIAKFCPLSFLKDPGSSYLKDGVFCIRVYIDFMNMKSKLAKSKNEPVNTNGSE